MTQRQGQAPLGQHCQDLVAWYQGTFDTMIDHLRHQPDHYATELTAMLLAAVSS